MLVDERAAALLASGKISDVHANEPFGTRLAQLYENHRDETPHIFRIELHRHGFFDLFAHPYLLERAHEILGTEIRLYTNRSRRCRNLQQPTVPSWNTEFIKPCAMEHGLPVSEATQSTLRPTQGHLLCSERYPFRVVRDAKHWATLKFQ